MNARRALMDREELEAWLTGDLAALAGLDPEDVRASLAAEQAREGLKGVGATAALMLHADGAPEARVLDFLRHFGPSNEARARQSLRFISQPNFRAYIFTYLVGADLVRGVLDREGPPGFARLLREPVTPGQLREGATA